jgi:hypothetical protein
MKRIKIYLIALMATFSFLSACKKDTNSLVSGESSAPRLLKVEQDAGNSATYSYNTEGLLSTSVIVHNQVTTTAVATYDAAAQPVSVTIGDEIYKLVYSNGRISRIDIYESSNPVLVNAYFSYTYTNGKVTEAAYYVPDELQVPKLSAKAVSIYNVAGDLVSRKTYYINGESLELAAIESYEYDTKINPLAGYFNLPAQLLSTPSAHNMTKQTMSDAAGNISETDNYAISYNSNNYPAQVACKTTKPGAAEVTTTRKYIY